MDDLMCKVQIRHKEEQFSLNTEHVMILYGYCLKPDQLFASKLACYLAFLLICQIFDRVSCSIQRKQ